MPFALILKNLEFGQMESPTGFAIPSKVNQSQSNLMELSPWMEVFW